jgi:predicted porin
MGTYEEGNVDINAWMLSTKLQLEPAYNYGFLAGFDYLSGDDQFAVPDQGQIGVIHHKTIKGFNPVYGSHHQFYGAMDFFYVSTYVNGFTPGLQNAYIGGHYKPIKGLDISAKYHYLAIATNLKDIDKTLGHEIEIEASYKIMKDVNLSAGYSYMIGTETMERLKRASDQGSLRWAWLSLGISPKLFTNKW